MNNELLNHNAESKEFVRTLYTSVFLLIIIITLLALFFPKYTLVFPVFLLFFPLFTYLFINKLEIVTLAFISVLPLIQHLNTKGLKIGDFILTFHMVVLFLIILLTFLRFLFFYSNQEMNRINKIDKLFLLLTVVSLVSLIFPYSLQVNHTKRWLLFYTGIFEVVSFYFVIKYFLSMNKDYSRTIIIAMVLSVFASSIVAFIELSEFGFSPVKIYLARMVIGFGYHNMNLFGINAALLLPICFYAATSKSFSNLKFITYPAIFLIILFSVLTLNRGTFIILGFQLVLLFFIKSTRKFIYIVSIAGLGALIYLKDLVFLYIYRFLGAGGGSQVVDLVDKSAQYRLEAWSTALKLIFIYPLGLGAGGFQFGWEKYGPDPTVYLGTPHQLFLSIGVDYGIIAMIVYFILIVSIIFYSHKISKEDLGEESYRQRFISISILGYLFYGMITVGELSHLSGFKYPNNGYSLILVCLIAITNSVRTKNT